MSRVFGIFHMCREHSLYSPSSFVEPVIRLQKKPKTIIVTLICSTKGVFV